MTYTDDQIKRAKEKYTEFLCYKKFNPNQYHVNPRIEEEAINYHNCIIDAINGGDKSLEKEWKMYFINQVEESDFRKSVKNVKEDLTAAIKAAGKFDQFLVWLKNEGRVLGHGNQSFSKKYTEIAVNDFMKSI